MRVSSCLLWLLLSTLLCCVLGARILSVNPVPGKSHFIFTHSILSALAARGHQVTAFSPFSPSKPVPNMKYIELHTTFEETMKKRQSFDQFRQMTSATPFYGLGIFLVWHMSYGMCEEVLNHKGIKDLVASKEKFDLIVIEALFGQESLLALGHLFKAPVVNINGFGPFSVMNRVHGNDLQIASYPDPVSFPFTNQMDFVERVRNFISTVGTLYFYYTSHLPKHQEIIKNTLKDPNIPPLTEMVENISITLTNFHPTMSYPLAVTSNIVPIGGVHISEELAPLPQDVKEFLDRGKNSVIYFSLGTVVPTHLMPPEFLQMFVNVFSKLPYKVLWKIEADSVPNLPANVKISKWLPQQSVLAHPNVVLFITHGGLLSQHEAFHAGVPVVGIPFFGDQPFNVQLYEHLGVGVKLDFNTLSEESLSKAILSVAGKQSFIDNVKKVKQQYHHRPMSPKDTAVYWAEYVLRHEGARHLRPVSATLPWYTLSLLDVLLVILATLFTILYLLFKVMLVLYSWMSGRGSKQTVSSKKKKN